MSLPASLLLGALLGVSYAAASLLVVRRARTLEPNAALRVVLVGMMVRMTLMLAAVAAILLTVPLHRTAFVLGLGVVFVAGLIAEVFLVLGPTADAR